jgi:hypothetical protein
LRTPPGVQLDRSAPSATARSVLLAGSLSVVAVRAIFIFTQRIDSDEPQHLHVVWGWTRGLIQYRDVFDNHFPLLHLLFSPVMLFAPESSAALYWMRVAILPVALGCSILLYLAAAPLFGRRIAAVAALLFSVMPPWLSTTVEFRNDSVWIFFWLAAIAVLVRSHGERTLFAGVLLGLSLLASVKSAPLFLAHVIAGGVLLTRVRVGSATRVVAGAALPVIAMCGALAAFGALDDMVYQTLLFNASTPLPAARRVGGSVAFVVLAPLLASRTWRRASTSRPSTHLAAFAAWYVLILLCFWPILTPRDFLPIVPVAAVGAAIALKGRTRPAAAVLLIASAASVNEARLWRQDDQRERFIDAVVHVTEREDYVVDLKGESVFRRRAVRPIYEDVGRALTAKGALPDEGPESIAATGACAAVPDSSHIPPRTRAFLQQYFRDAGPLRVCRGVVEQDKLTIGVPQVYTVVARNPASVSIDGIPWRGPRFLSAGRHSLARGDNETLEVIWWRTARQ